jgi:hypothetical protein
VRALSELAKIHSDRYTDFHQQASDLLLAHFVKRGTVKRGSLYQLVAKHEGFEYVFFPLFDSVFAQGRRGCERRFRAREEGL